MNPLPGLKVTISKTSDGQHVYMQIVSSDQLALNIVLIASEIDVTDSRLPGGQLPEKPKKKRP